MCFMQATVGTRGAPFVKHPDKDQSASGQSTPVFYMTISAMPQYQVSGILARSGVLSDA